MCECICMGRSCNINVGGYAVKEYKSMCTMITAIYLAVKLLLYINLKTGAHEVESITTLQYACIPLGLGVVAKTVGMEEGRGRSFSVLL